MLIETIPVTHYQQNSSLLIDQDSGLAAIVDPGGDLDRILSAIERHQVKLEKILLTHAHIDHCGAAANLAEQLNVPIEGPHAEEQFWIDLIPSQVERFGFSHVRSFTPARWFNDLDTVMVGTSELIVRHCPGHTPGHVCYIHENDRFAIVGDVLFAGSIGRTDFPRGNHAQLISAIRERLFPYGDDMTFFPGHGPTSTFGEERLHNPFLQEK